MSKVRINDLAREMEVKSRQILDVLGELGLGEGKTHSSSIEDYEADKVRAHGWVEPGDGYYTYFLRALENLLREKGIVDASTLELKMREDTAAGHEDHEH